MIPAFFSEFVTHASNTVDLATRAAPLADAIRSGHVLAVAPDALWQEFLTVGYRKARPRTGLPVVTTDELQAIYLEFVSLPISSRRAADLAAVALDLTVNAGISPADSWYVACALDADAEFWMSHEHRDGLAAKAVAAGCRVFTLLEHRFRL